jgi:RNA polymerase sigma factor (sigma-70 family)
VDEDTWHSQVFTQHWQTVRRLVARRLPYGLADLADDITQEVFMIAWVRRARIDHENPFPWLYHTAVNLLRNRVRRIRTAQRHTISAEAAWDTVAETAAQNPYGKRDVEVSVDLNHALAALSRTERELYLLAYLDGKSSGEIAQLLRLKPAAVRKRLERMRSRLRARLGQDYLNSLCQTHTSNPMTSPETRR